MLAPDERTVEQGIPVTTVARTLLDLAGVLTRQQLGRAANEAEVMRLAGALSLPGLVARHPHRRGIVAVRALVDDGRSGATVTRSELEDRFLALVRRAKMADPQVKALVSVGDRTIEVDFLWPAARLALELDGHAAQSTRAAFERDRERDRLLALAGWRTVRLTWRQLHGDPACVTHDLGVC